MGCGIGPNNSASVMPATRMKTVAASGTRLRPPGPKKLMDEHRYKKQPPTAPVHSVMFNSKLWA